MKNIKNKNIIKKQDNFFTYGKVFLFLFSFICIFLTLQPVQNFDLWWVLKTGQVLIELKSFPPHDIFSYTAGRTPWIHYGWLSSILLYLMYYTGGSLFLQLFKTILVLISFYIVIFIAYKRTGEDLTSSALAGVWMLFACTTMHLLNVRSLIFSLVYMTLCWLILEKAYCEKKLNLLFWLPPLTLLWVNTHTSFILSLFLQGVYIFNLIAELYVFKKSTPEKIKKFFALNYSNVSIRDEKSTPLPDAPGGKKTLRTALVIFILSIILSAVNPNGTIIFKTPFESLDNFYVRHIAEFAKPDYLGLQLFFTISAIVVFLSLIIFHEKYRLRDYFILAGMFYLSFKAVRHTILFSYFALPAAAVFISSTGEFFRKLFSSFIEKAESVQKIATLVLLVLFIAASIKLYSGINYASLNKEWDVMPVGGVEFLKLNHIPGNMFNSYEWGGYLLWKLYPEYKVMIDGRGGMAYPEEVFRDLNEAVWVDDKWRAVMDKYKINFVITNKILEKVFSQRLPSNLRNSPDWVLIYEDAVENIFIRNSPENRALIEKLRTGTLSLPITPYSLNMKALKYLKAGNITEGKKYVEQALAVYPDFVPALRNKAYVLASEKKYKEAIKVYKEILKINPKEPEVNFNLGQLYEATGNIAAARRMYRRELRINGKNAVVSSRLRNLDKY